MGIKTSSVACKPSTIDYIRKKDVRKLTRQLSKRRVSFRKNNRSEQKNGSNNERELKLDLTQDEQQRSALHFAACEGDAKILVTLFDFMQTVNVFDKYGRSPLHYAAIVGNEETLLTLLLCHPDVNAISQDGTTALHESIIHNHPRCLTLLLQHDADSLILYQDYLPSIILAVYLKHKTIVEMLVRIGIDPSVREKRFGRTALHYAAYFHDDVDIFEVLLTSKIYPNIDINAKDDFGFSILDFARSNVRGSTAIADFLLQLNVYDPYRGEISVDQIEIEIPTMKIFRTPSLLSSLTKEENIELPSKKSKNEREKTPVDI